MKAKLISHKPKTFVVVLDTGDEVAGLLKQFAQDQRLEASHFSAHWRLQRRHPRLFQYRTKRLRQARVNEPVEVLSRLGNVTLANGKPKIHAHVVVGKADGTAHGGHLLEAHVRPTLELILEESSLHLKRREEPTTGLALIDLDQK